MLSTFPHLFPVKLRTVTDSYLCIRYALALIFSPRVHASFVISVASRACSVQKSAARTPVRLSISHLASCGKINGWPMQMTSEGSNAQRIVHTREPRLLHLLFSRAFCSMCVLPRSPTSLVSLCFFFFLSLPLANFDSHSLSWKLVLGFEKKTIARLNLLAFTTGRQIKFPTRDDKP